MPGISALHMLCDLLYCCLNFVYCCRLAYCLWMLKDMASELQQNNIKLKLLYDIACVVQKHVQISSRIYVYSLVIVLIDLTSNLRGKICLTLCTM